jgi:hypothetical protein
MQRQEALIAGDIVLGAIPSLTPVRLPALPRVPRLASVTGDHGWRQVISTFDTTGTLEAGAVYRVALPRTDVQATAFGVQLNPRLAASTEITFLRLSDGSALAKYVLVLLDSEVSPLLADLMGGSSGLQGSPCTALVDHLPDLEPRLRYLHGSLRGDLDRLATVLATALQRTGTPFGKADSDRAGVPFAADDIRKIVGWPGTVDHGVLTIRLPRSEPVTENGLVLPPAMQLQTTLAFQAGGAAGQVVARGDLLLVPHEIQPVVDLLQSKGMVVTALHGHEPSVLPNLCHLHTWATGAPEELAASFRAALDLTNSAPPRI